MAKRRNRVAKRGSTPTTSNAFRALPSRTLVFPVSRPVDLSLYEDRRVFHPERAYRPALSFSRKSSAVVKLVPPMSPKRGAARVSGVPRFPDVLGFTNPLKVLLCVRRKERREVIIAKKLQGKGAGGSKGRNWWSNIKC